MAKIKKLKENGSTIYPATIPQAVVDPDSKETLSTILSAFSDAVSYGKTPLQAAQALQDIFGDDSPGEGFTDLVSAMRTIGDFLYSADASQEAINRWKEIESFLAGITDTETLTGLLAENLQSAKSYTDANKYTLPVATGSTLGGVKSGGAFVSIGSDGIITVNRSLTSDNAENGENGDNIVNTYSKKADLPVVATASKAGLVKSGNHIRVAADGTVTVTAAEVAANAALADQAVCDQENNIIHSTYLKSEAVNDVTEYPEVTI